MCATLSHIEAKANIIDPLDNVLLQPKKKGIYAAV
jgi:hypothetical protein